MFVGGLLIVPLNWIPLIKSIYRYSTALLPSRPKEAQQLCFCFDLVFIFLGSNISKTSRPSNKSQLVDTWSRFTQNLSLYAHMQTKIIWTSGFLPVWDFRQTSVGFSVLSWTELYPSTSIEVNGFRRQSSAFVHSVNCLRHPSKKLLVSILFL